VLRCGCGTSVQYSNRLRRYFYGELWQKTFPCGQDGFIDRCSVMITIHFILASEVSTKLPLLLLQPKHLLATDQSAVASMHDWRVSPLGSTRVVLAFIAWPRGFKERIWWKLIARECYHFRGLAPVLLRAPRKFADMQATPLGLVMNNVSFRLECSAATPLAWRLAFEILSGSIPQGCDSGLNPPLHSQAYTVYFH
jgi:hypothetical protein